MRTATEGEISALRAVVGSRSWIARQCGPDEAGTASTLRRSDSRPLWKICQTQTDPVNRVKQNENIGIHINVVPLDDLRTAAVSGAALGLGQT